MNAWHFNITVGDRHFLVVDGELREFTGPVGSTLVNVTSSDTPANYVRAVVEMAGRLAANKQRESK